MNTTHSTSSLDSTCSLEQLSNAYQQADIQLKSRKELVTDAEVISHSNKIFLTVFWSSLTILFIIWGVLKIG